MIIGFEKSANAITKTSSAPLRIPVLANGRVILNIVRVCVLPRFIEACSKLESIERNEISIIINATGNKLRTWAITTPQNPYILNWRPKRSFKNSVITPRLPNKIIKDKEKIKGGATIGNNDSPLYTFEIALLVRVTYSAKGILILLTIDVDTIPPIIMFMRALK